MGNQAAVRRDAKSILQSYHRFPAALVRGKGSWVWDADGKRYLDFLTGITVNTVGHSNPRVIAAMRAQLGKITHVGNLFYSPLQAELAEELKKISFASKVAFANTGAEANELCIKFARKWGFPRGKHEIITFANSFHGRTYGALTATAQKKMHVGLGPMLPGFKYAKYNDLKSVERLISKKTCAIMVEPIQGEGGVNVGSAAFLKGLRRLCDRKGLLLIVDEIQTGLGRSGKMFCYQHFGRGFLPDVMSLGKALGGGLPLAAVLVGRKAEKLISKGEHGTTMGGNAVAVAGGLALLKELKKARLAEKAERDGKKLRASLEALKAEFPLIREVRGRGLMTGVELSVPSAPVAALAFKRGLIVNATAGNVVRLHPPLNAKDSEIRLAIRILRGVFSTLTTKGN